MTRAEQAAEKVRKAQAKLAEKERKLKADIARQQRVIAVAKVQERYELKVDTNKRRYHIGTLVDEYGLFVWSNATLNGIFTVLARLRDVPDPVALLDALVGADAEGCPGSVEPLLAEKSLTRSGFSPSRTEVVG